MPSFGFARPVKVTLQTAFGGFDLDMGETRRLRALAGHGDAPTPLRVGGEDIALRMTFAFSDDTGRFSLVADGSMIAWNPDAPGKRPATGAWVKAAQAVEDALEEFLDEEPNLVALAELQGLEAQLAALEETLLDPAPDRDSLVAQRDALAAKLVRKRRSLMNQVA